MGLSPELLRGFRAGEPEALREVYVRHHDEVDTLVRFGFTTAGPPPARIPGVAKPSREDVVQEVFLKAFREPARLAYDGSRPYLPYLLTIAKNLCIDRYRRFRRERMHSVGSLVDIDPILAGTSTLQMPQEEDREFQALEARTRELVRTLDAEQQTFVALRFQQELSQADVAARMGVTRRRVRTLETQVLDALRRHLAARARANQAAHERPNAAPTTYTPEER